MKVGIIILNYNDASTTMHLVKKIEEYNCFNQIIVIDNCSSDNSYSRLCTLRSNKVDIIKSDKNGGYAYGNNLGIKFAIAKYNLDVIFIANPDVEFEENLVLKIIKQFNMSDYAMLSGVMANTNGELSPSSAWNIPTFLDDVIDSFVLFSHVRNRKKKLSTNDLETVREVEVLSGSFFAIRASAIQSIGYFDEGTFLYCEERIIGKKLQNKGYKVGLLTKEKYLHIHGSSIKKNMKVIQMRKMLFKSRYYYQKEYNKINTFQKLFLKICMSLSLLDYSVYLLLKEVFRKKESADFIEDYPKE